MTVFNKYRINSVDIYDAKDMSMTLATSDYSSSSRLESDHDNFIGIHANDFIEGQSAAFWAGQLPLNGIVSFYKFSGNAKDEMQVNDGTVSNATLTADKNNKLSNAYLFNGTTSYISLPSISKSQWSISVWINPTLQDSYKRIFGQASNNLEIALITAGSNVSLQIYDGAWRDTAVLITPNSWNHLVITFDGTNLRVIHNGTQDYSGVIGRALSGTCRIGSDVAGTAFYSGVIDQFGIWDRALNDWEIKNIYNGGNLTTIEKLFGGIITQKKYQGFETDETVHITCRDYTSKLQTIDTQVEIYTNTEVSAIVTDLMSKYGPVGIGYSTYVQNTGVTLQRKVFKADKLFNCLSELASLVEDFFLYVDPFGELHFQQKSRVSSSITLDNTNVVSSDFITDIENVKNEIYVYGNRAFVANPRQTFTADGVGSVFTLNNVPYNTKVTISGTTPTEKKGDLYKQNVTPGSGVDYLVNQLDKTVIFLSGTSLGYNAIPGSLSKIWVDSDVSRAIIKFAEDVDSKAAYGVRSETIVDQRIQDPTTAANVATSRLALAKDAGIQGTCKTQGVVLAIPGETVLVNLPNKGQVNKTFDIIESSYSFNLQNTLYDYVLTIKMGKRLPDITDTIKNLLLAKKRLEASQIDDTGILSRIASFTGSVGINTNLVRVSTKAINDTFIFGHPINGVLGVVNGYTAGSLTGSINWVSGLFSGGYPRALEFTGSSAIPPKATCINNLSGILPGSGDHTVLLWHKPYVKDQALVTSLAGAGGIYPQVRISNGSLLAYELQVNGATKTVSGAYNFVNNTPYHIGTIYNSSTGSAYTYVNGSDITTTGGNVGVGSLTTASASGLQFGYSSNTNTYASGVIDDVRIYNRALSDTEIKAVYNGSLICAGLIGYFKFDEGSGALFYNSVNKPDQLHGAYEVFRFDGSGTTTQGEGQLTVGSVVGSVNFIVGTYGTGSQLFLSGGYVNLNNYASGAIGSQFSIGTWIRPGSAVTNQDIFAKKLSGSDIIELTYNNGSLNFGYGNGAGSDYKTFTTGLSVDREYHVGISYNGSASVYLNGSYLASSTGLSGGRIPAAGSFYIGCVFPGSMPYYGRVDDLRFHASTLSQSQWKDIYEGRTIQPLLGDRRGGSVLAFTGS